MPLCAYVEEEFEVEDTDVAEDTEVVIEEKKVLSNETNVPGAIFDPDLGCVKCGLESTRHCKKVSQKICKKPRRPKLAPDPQHLASCHPCPPISKTSVVNLDIADQEAFKKCDGTVSRDKFGRLIVYERKCKSLAPRRCKLARNFGRKECHKRQICYKKPRLVNRKTARNMKCLGDEPEKFMLKAILKKHVPLSHPNCDPLCDVRRLRRQPLIRAQNQNQPGDEICRIVERDECEPITIRVCDRLPPESCEIKTTTTTTARPQPKKKMVKKVVLKCTEVANIPSDVIEELSNIKTV